MSIRLIIFFIPWVGFVLASEKSSQGFVEQQIQLLEIARAQYTEDQYNKLLMSPRFLSSVKNWHRLYGKKRDDELPEHWRTEISRIRRYIVGEYYDLWAAAKRLGNEVDPVSLEALKYFYENEPLVTEKVAHLVVNQSSLHSVSEEEYQKVVDFMTESLGIAAVKD